MRAGYDQFPHFKQVEIDRVVRAIFEEYDDAMSQSNPDRRDSSKILKVILYGSHARGDWVFAPDTKIGHNSDYDILIVVSDTRLKECEPLWVNLSKRLRLDFTVTHRILSPVQYIVHTINEMNDMLRHGRYFWIDVVREGVLLYDTEGVNFAEPEQKSPAEALKCAVEYYDTWFSDASEYFDDYVGNVEKKRLKKAAFELHQCVERLYQCVLLVRTFYTPYVHDIIKLRAQAELTDGRLVPVWPRWDKDDVDSYEKLQEAYAKARYRRDFQITDQQLDWLGERTVVLTDLVRAICDERILELERAAHRSS